MRSQEFIAGTGLRLYTKTESNSIKDKRQWYESRKNVEMEYGKIKALVNKLRITKVLSSGTSRPVHAANHRMLIYINDERSTTIR